MLRLAVSLARAELSRLSLTAVARASKLLELPKAAAKAARAAKGEAAPHQPDLS